MWWNRIMVNIKRTGECLNDSGLRNIDDGRGCCNKLAKKRAKLIGHILYGEAQITVYRSCNL